MGERILRLYLTDLTVHHRQMRPTTSYYKAIRKVLPNGQPYGRLYGGTLGPVNKDGKRHFSISLPPDLKERIERGELNVEFIVPKGGLPVLGDEDVMQKISQLMKKAARRLFPPTRVWRADK